MSRRLVLHVGLSKTGTTTLQATLQANAVALLEQGLLYPTLSDGSVNHNTLLRMVAYPVELPRILKFGTLRREESKEAGRALWSEVLSQVEAAPGATTVLSGEYFFGLRTRLIGLLGEALRAEFEHIAVVAYIRDPVAHYVASTQQRVRASGVVKSPERFRLRLREHVEAYAAFADDVVLVPYDRRVLRNGDIVDDFVDRALGLDATALGIERRPDRNVSMSGEAMCVLQLLRRRCWPLDDNRFLPATDQLLRRLGALAAITPSDPGGELAVAQAPARLRPEAVATILANHAADLRFLAAGFDLRFPDLDLDALPAAPATTSPSEDDDADDDDDEHNGEPPARTDEERSQRRARAYDPELELVDVLDVDPDAIDRLLFQLVRDLAERSADLARRRALDAQRREQEAALASATHPDAPGAPEESAGGGAGDVPVSAG